MTVPEVLARFNHPKGHAGRTRCPLHDGGNVQSFSYELTRWYCFACNQGGGARDLLQRLIPADFVGLPSLGPQSGMGGASNGPSGPNMGILGMVSTGFFPPKRSEILTQRVHEARDRVLMAWDREHREAIEDWGLADACFRLGDADLGWTILSDAWDRLWRAEAVCGCDCRSESLETQQPWPIARTRAAMSQGSRGNC